MKIKTIEIVKCQSCSALARKIVEDNGEIHYLCTEHFNKYIDKDIESDNSTFNIPVIGVQKTFSGFGNKPIENKKKKDSIDKERLFILEGFRILYELSNPKDIELYKASGDKVLYNRIKSNDKYIYYLRDKFIFESDLYGNNIKYLQG